MPVIRAREGVAHETHGARFTMFAAPARGSRELCAWRLDIPAGCKGTAHRVTREEVLLLLDGTLRVSLDDGPGEAITPGDAVLLHAGSSWCVDNDSAEPATAWVTTSVGLNAVMADGSWISPPWTS